MNSKAKITVASIISILSLASFGFSDGHSGDTYGPYPVTLKGYSGSKMNSVLILVKLEDKCCIQVLRNYLHKVMVVQMLEK